MKKIKDNYQEKVNLKLQNLFQQRKAPLQKEALNQVLWQLTKEIATNVHFYAYVYLKSDLNENLSLLDITKVNLLIADDNQQYLPAYSGLDKIVQSHYQAQKGEVLVAFTKEELRDFVAASSRIHAISLNPTIDDIILSLPQIQNLIQIEKES